MRRTLMSLVHPVASGIALLAVAASALAQGAPTKPPPVIDRASYLTPQQKRDILYNNAARFLRLDKATTTSSNGSSGQ